MSETSITDLSIHDIPTLNSIKPDDWTSITEIHEHYSRSTACHCIKAVNNGNEILGIGTGIHFESTGWLAHIIVSKNHQRKGIGTLIVQDRIILLREKYNCRTITLTATDQGYPVYKKLGFVEESEYLIMIRPQDYQTSYPGDENIVKAEQKYFGVMLEIDRITSGENREGLLTPVLAGGYAYVKNGKVQGFYLPHFGDCGVAAITQEAGIALLRERTRNEKNIFIPEENLCAYDFLVDNGYTEAKRIYRMILGEHFKHSPQNCYSRIGGFAG